MQSQAIYNAIIALPGNFAVEKIGIQTRSGRLNGIDFLPPATDCKSADNLTAQQAVDQLNEYFRHGTFQFDLPLSIQGTPYQQRVWQALLNTRAGQTYTYGHLAAQLNSSARAVGNACRANFIPIVIPCHRVVAKQGIGGYCGQTQGRRMQIKQWLLDHERR
jgi:methylated-DNA-[protein]-cysteine S-methyltransferase